VRGKSCTRERCGNGAKGDVQMPTPYKAEAKKNTEGAWEENHMTAAVQGFLPHKGIGREGAICLKGGSNGGEYRLARGSDVWCRGDWSGIIGHSSEWGKRRGPRGTSTGKLPLGKEVSDNFGKKQKEPERRSGGGGSARDWGL